MYNLYTFFLGNEVLFFLNLKGLPYSKSRKNTIGTIFEVIRLVFEIEIDVLISSDKSPVSDNLQSQ